ncbi:putative protease Do-like 14 [Mercurialis annua]|uniref:putative protease Do-like 14 n=1 Tax=Mercurialis annua TaxID=3986 RepID=UPI0021604D01|nr:putative protease Do-like 14 [Mercurialis annua]
MLKRKADQDDPSPWRREEKIVPYTPEEWDCMKHTLKQYKFAAYNENQHLDIYTKRAALKAAPFVVSLVAYIGEEMLYQSSGTIIESDDVSSVILTSANLITCPPTKTLTPDNIKVLVYLKDGRSFHGEVLTFNPHYNIAAIRIQSNAHLPTASMRHLDDSITIDSSQLHFPEEKTFQLRPHSNSYNLLPGDRLFAIGRYFVKPYDIMIAPGEFCLGRCDYDCKELFRASCNISRCGIGGPLINYNGEVVGICFYNCSCTPFLPINVVSKWWNQYKTNGITRQPYLGIELTNLYAAKLYVMEEIIQKFPNICKGVIVEEVIPGSVADLAGIRPKDVIIEFGGKTVHGFLELIELMWDKVGDSVELVVLRASDGSSLKLSMLVEEATPDKSYSWPLWENAR